MKKWGILVVLLLVMSIAAGCGNADKASSASKSTVSATIGQNGGQIMQSPEGKLGRAIMNITRIQRSEKPLTKEQMQKLTTIINDIKAKAAIDETYANQKISEINAILTEQQKQLMSTGQGTFNGNRNGGNVQKNSNSNGQQLQQPQNRQENGQRRGNGGTGNEFNGNGFDIKSLCDRALTTLEEIKK